MPVAATKALRPPQITQDGHEGRGQVVTRRRVCGACARTGRGKQPPDSPAKTRAAKEGRLLQESGKGLLRCARAFAFPFIFFAQLGLVFFDLGFEFAKGFLATGSHGCSRGGGVQRSGRQG